MDYIEIFKDFIQFDKEFVDSLIDRYSDGMTTLGQAIDEHKTQKMYVCYDEFTCEFVDFIDGNGFIVNRNDSSFFSKKWFVVEIDLEVLERYEERQKPQPQPAFSTYFSMQQEILSYASMESNKRYILELPQFLPSRPLRLCIRGCMEFSRLVSKSGRSCAKLPRPP